jgi:hypothetical protein
MGRENAMPTISDIIEQSQRQTVQSQVSEPVPEAGGVFSVLTLARAGTYIAPWWSFTRDKDLRNFWKKSDHLSGAIYAVESKMTAIPRKVVARDPSIREHVRQAEILTEEIQASAQFGKGWEAFFGKFVEELLTQDNGAFAEVIGEGPKDGPIIGAPISVAHLDSTRCQRTNNAEFPVVYEDTDGKHYKLHWTRVIHTSQMTSPKIEMNGVGFCAVSRAINVAQTLIDILLYKQEKLGSRPHRAILIPRGGLDPTDLRSAFEMAASEMDTESLSRYSRTVIAGSSAMPEADIAKIELSTLPDGFDEQSSIIMGMATIALALGVDARELFPAMQAGATRADALLAHIKQRGKAPGQIIQTVELLFDTKVLPIHLKFLFDFQDDAQDRQEADIRLTRANARTQDMTSGVVTSSVARQTMVNDGDLDQGQYELMELQDGRLPDGTPILTLFYSEDKLVKRFLNVGSDDPLDIGAHDIAGMLEVILENLAVAQKTLVNDRDPEVRKIALRSTMALAKLQDYYLNPRPISELLLEKETGPNGNGNRIDERQRRDNLAEPNQEEELGTAGEKLTEDTDDSVSNAADPNRGAK